MSTKDHNDTVAANTASTVTIHSALHYPNLSIAQAIEQAIADSSKPSEQSLLGSALPNDLFKNPGLSQLEAHLGRYSNDPSSNPSQSDGHDPLGDLAGGRGSLPWIRPINWIPLKNLPLSKAAFRQ